MSWKPTTESNKLLLASQRILNEYSESITLRQLYYLLIADGLLDFTPKSYRKIKNLMVKARRHERITPTAFSTPEKDVFEFPTTEQEYLNEIVKNFRIPRTYLQDNHVEIWVEREPLKTYIESLVSQYDIPVYVTGGFSNFSFTHNAVERLKKSVSKKGSPRILYFSDFSPASYNMFMSQVHELSDQLGLTNEEMCSILLRVGLEPEHIVKYALPVLEQTSSSDKTTHFEEDYSELLELVGIPRLPVVEIEALNPSNLAELVYNTIFCLIDQSAMGDVAVLEGDILEKLRTRFGDTSGT